MLLFIVPTETQEDRWEWLMEHLGDKEVSIFLQEAKTILGNAEDAEDVVQEALLKGAMRCHQLRDETKLFYWMLKIVKNEAYAYYKRFSVHTWLAQAQLILTKAPYADSTEYLFIKMQEKERLEKAVLKLEHPDKDILKLRINEDMSFPEIAEKLHMNYHTVRSRYQRMLRKLKKALEEY